MLIRLVYSWPQKCIKVLWEQIIQDGGQYGGVEYFEFSFSNTAVCKFDWFWIAELEFDCKNKERIIETVEDCIHS